MILCFFLLYSLVLTKKMENLFIFLALLTLEETLDAREMQDRKIRHK